MNPFKRKKEPDEEKLFSLLLNEILDERAKRIWEKIKDR
ncbi:hypothetical protein AciM339_0442 [Aciduliprofundum sp. MAR08-339]|nr:hypothetical protein AciM339_0442 [Aciduliprofundum sp. MAR08-339]